MPKSEGEKYSVGAVCLANLNDTNGNGIPDYQETNITQNALGRNEIDLMKLVIRPRETGLNLSGDVTLRKLSGNSIKLWTSPVKLSGTDVSLPMTVDASELPITLYVEALQPSTTARDIVLEAEFAGRTDKVSATAVWVEIEKVYHRPEDMPDFASLGVDGCHMNQITTNQSADGSYFGFGTWEFFQGQNIQRMGNRIFFHWKLIPKDARHLVEIDGTRQRETRNWTIHPLEPEVLIPDCKFITNHTEFPFNLADPLDNELPNDDRYKSGLCSSLNDITESGSFFTYDAPAIIINGEFLTLEGFPIYWGFSNDKNNFLEWVRVAPRGYNFNPPFIGSGKLLGSRGSIKYEWAASRYAKKDKNFLHVKDNKARSLSHIRVNSMGSDHNFYPIDYSVATIDHSYPLATYIGVIFKDEGNTTLFLTRIEPDINGECNVEVENITLELSGNPASYEVIFDDHSLEIEEVGQFESIQLIWNTFYSSNKRNELKINGHFSNLNH